MTAKRRPILMGEAERIAAGIEDVCPTLLTRTTLVAASLQRPDRDDSLLSVTSKCHRTEGVKVWFRPSDGRVLLICAKCGSGVAWMQIANEEPS